MRTRRRTDSLPPLLLGLLAALWLGSCASTPPGGAGGGGAPPPPSYEKQTTQPLAGARCASGRCQCRSLDDAADAKEVSPEEAERKRYELRLLPTMDPEWLVIDGRTIYRAAEKAEESCYYVDLTPGRHEVVFHVEAQDPARGAGLGLDLNEYGAKREVWYKTFRVRCGEGGETCSENDLAAWAQEMDKVARGIHDPCGSTRIEKLRWEAAPRERGAPGAPALTVAFTLHVYKFRPQKVPGSSDCRLSD